MHYVLFPRSQRSPSNLSKKITRIGKYIRSVHPYTIGVVLLLASMAVSTTALTRDGNQGHIGDTRSGADVRSYLTTLYVKPTLSSKPIKASVLAQHLNKVTSQNQPILTKSADSHSSSVSNYNTSFTSVSVNGRTVSVTGQGSSNTTFNMPDGVRASVFMYDSNTENSVTTRTDVTATERNGL